MALRKVVSGGQTGADRAGLDAAMGAGISVGGYCPKGRLAEDGTVPDIYPLTELGKGGYPARTEKNVSESDGTLVLNLGKVTGGTRLTINCAVKQAKPCRVVQLDEPLEPEATLEWIRSNKIEVLNVAGPRESKCPGLHARAADFLRLIFVPAKAAIYPEEKEGLLMPTETPPPGWRGTWSGRDPYNGGRG